MNRHGETRATSRSGGWKWRNQIAAVAATLLCLTATVSSFGQVGVRYQDPPGGWKYIFTGDAANGPPHGTPGPALDNTWDHEVGSDTWDGDGRGTGNGPPGGVESNSGILTIEDALGISSSATNHNRKIYFIHALGQDGVTNNNLLDTGVTLSFRARLMPADAKTEITNSVPNGYGIFGQGQGMFGIRQNNPGAIISFSLVNAVEDASTNSTLNFTAAGLTMNRLNGDVPGSVVDSTNNAAFNPIVPLDPAVFHHFWITIRSNSATAGNGTHEVVVYVDGSLLGTTNNVTAGNSSNKSTNYLALGLNQSAAVGAFDTDFFAYKPGVIQPVALFNTGPADNFVDRSPLSGTNLLVNGSTIGATSEYSNEHTYFDAAAQGNPDYSSVWWTWTAPANGGCVITVSSSLMERPILAVFTGNTVSNLTRLVANTTSFSRARVAFTAVAGMTYQIGVASVPIFDQQDFSLNLQFTPPPTNNLFATRTTIPGHFYEVSGSFVGGGREAGETNHGVRNLPETLWWNWTAPTDSGLATSRVRLIADSVSLPPDLGVYTGTVVSNLSSVPLTANITNGMTRVLDFTATAGQTYQIALAGQQHDPAANVMAAEYGSYRLRLYNRWIVLSFPTNVNTSFCANGSNSCGPATDCFTASAKITNYGNTGTGPLRIQLQAVSGSSAKGTASAPASTLCDMGTNLVAPAGLSVAQGIAVAVSGTLPPIVDPSLDFESGTGTGWGGFATLQERQGTNWFSIDQTLIAFGPWPTLGSPNTGPGGGVIRLDPNIQGLASNNPLASLQIIGPAIVVEGKTTNYSGMATYNFGQVVSYTQTVWLASQFKITTNGLFTAGSVSSNTTVKLTNYYSYHGVNKTVSNSVIVSNLPPPSLSGTRVVAKTNLIFTLSGVPGRTNRIEMSTNLVPPFTNWVPLITNAPISGIFTFTNLIQTNFPRRFYRAREME